MRCDNDYMPPRDTSGWGLDRRRPSRGNFSNYNTALMAPDPRRPRARLWRVPRALMNKSDLMCQPETRTDSSVRDLI